MVQHIYLSQDFVRDAPVALSANEGYQSGSPASILPIFFSEEVDQITLLIYREVSSTFSLLGKEKLTHNAMRKELPQGYRIGNEGEVVPEHQLRSQRPVEEAEIAGMANPPVDATRNKHMIVSLVVLHYQELALSPPAPQQHANSPR